MVGECLASEKTVCSWKVGTELRAVTSRDGQGKPQHPEGKKRYIITIRLINN
jgi:hypothetical protein